MPDRLGIHVLGPRYGESVVLELPDDAVAVIDSFASRDGSSPVLAFLQDRFPSLLRLKFFAVTHPHADHCWGASGLLDRAPPETFWVFRPFPAGEVQKYYHALKQLGTRDAVEAAVGMLAGGMALELSRLDRRVNTLRKQKHNPLAIRYFEPGKSVSLCSGRLYLTSLTPSDGFSYEYQQELAKLERRVLECALGKRKDTGGDADHNKASGAFLVRYGETRALLMADAEAPLWREWLTSAEADHLWPVHFLKVAHHGSANGYCADLYSHLADSGKTVAVVTPFDKGSVKLPTTDGITRIRKHVRELYCTNGLLAKMATDWEWESEAAATNIGLPAPWLARLQREPALTSLLVPPFGSGTSRGTATIPPEWAADCRSDPRLLLLFRPEYRTPTTPLGTAEHHRFSIYFDGHGHELSRFVGPGVGRLVVT